MVPFWVGAPPILVNFSADWDVHWGYGILTHGQMDQSFIVDFAGAFHFQPESCAFVGWPRQVLRTALDNWAAISREDVRCVMVGLFLIPYCFLETEQLPL